MQVGPLAQVLVGYAQGHPLTKKYAELALTKVSAIAGIHATPDLLHSTLGRHAARAIRAAMLADLADKHWQLLVNNIAKGDFSVHNQPVFASHEVEGVGTHEAPRGTLSHWVVIKDEKIKNYRPWCLRPGMPARATTRELPGLMKLLCCTVRSQTRRSRWRSCAQFTRSIRAWHAPAIHSIRAENRSRR
jgi:hypothetical protein